MGSGHWDTEAFSTYTTSTKGYATLDDYVSADYKGNAKALYKMDKLHQSLDPKGAIRECRDSAEHPNTLPVILGIDVTGSMGRAAIRVAQQLGLIMEDIFAKAEIPDVEFAVMGIGDTLYDRAPVQISQFESDVRIAQHLDNLYFEGGGGGNSCESYSAAWYLGTYRCDLDCWKRDQKGIIITLGDELPDNPNYRPDALFNAIGETGQMPSNLLEETQKKFNVFHISIDDSNTCYPLRTKATDKAWRQLLGQNYFVSTIEELPKLISTIIKDHCNSVNFTASSPSVATIGISPESAEVSW